MCLRVRSGSANVTHYLDDFHFTGMANSGECQDLLANFFDLEIPLAAEKIEGLASVLTFLGIRLDTTLSLSKLSQGKLVELQKLIHRFLARTKAALYDVQVLLDYLNFACRVGVLGNAFCDHLYTATVKVSAAHHFIMVTWEFREGLQLWKQFLTHFNGVSIWWHPLCLQVELQAHLAAAGGCWLKTILVVAVAHCPMT